MTMIDRLLPDSGWVSLVIMSKHKIKNLSFVIDDEMKLKSEEPSNAALAFCCQSPEHFMGMLSLNVAGF